MSDNEIRRVNKIKEGAQLERWRVRATIRRVYLLGYVENVVVKARALDGGKVHVRLEVFPRYQVRDVTVKGNYKLNDVEIIEDVLKMEMGDDFRVEDVPRLEQKLRDAYRDVGNLKADVKINVELTKLKLDNKADITIEVNERPTFRVVKIDLYGDLVPYSRSRLLRVLKWKEGMDYERERIDTGLNRLKTWLKKRQHYEARVSDIELDDEETADVNEDQSEITLKLRVDVGPRVEILYDDECFTCAQKKWKLDKHLDVENNRRFTRYIVEPYAESIEQYFRLRGYLDAAVTGEFEGGVDEDGRPVKRLLFLMDKGRKYKIEDIDFKNNPSYSDGDLEDEMDQGKYFLPEDFDKNLENAVAFYNRNGYIQAKVIQKSAEIDEGTGEIFLTVVMSEGPQAIINSVTLNGNEVLPDKKFAVTLEEQDLVPGLPYNPFLVAETKTRMIAKYLGRGYLKARIREKIKISEDGTKVDVVYDFVEGRQYFFGNVYVHGNKLTKKHVITRELFITSGDPFNYEDVFASQQQLMKLGFFNSVKIEPVNPDVDEEVVDLIVDVDERNAGYIQTGVGYNTYNGYQGAFELGHKNLAGHGRSIAFRTDVNFRDETFLFDQRLVAITFGWPWVARLPMDGELTLADDQRNLIGYDLRSLSATVALKVEFPKLFYKPARDAAERGGAFAVQILGRPPGLRVRA
ncbi:MAG: hypothetical protein M5R36_16615 [Deltaproteobacteria bacterium]|nr:hypothetical protein [Deltaproteobacteria bacterium]